MKTTTTSSILGERLMLAIRWLHWVRRHGNGRWPKNLQNPYGFAGRELSLAIVEKFDLLSSPLFSNCSLWVETLRLIETNPGIQALMIDVGALVDDLRVNYREERLVGLRRFLEAIASVDKLTIEHLTGERELDF